jgi:hypothetical protein
MLTLTLLMEKDVISRSRLYLSGYFQLFLYNVNVNNLRKGRCRSSLGQKSDHRYYHSRFFYMFYSLKDNITFFQHGDGNYSYKKKKTLLSPSPKDLQKQCPIKASTLLHLKM